jgi:hypothetical protein
MSIDIYVKWDGVSEAEENEQYKALFRTEHDP